MFTRKRRTVKVSDACAPCRAAGVVPDEGYKGARGER
jgi:hypothetical protein